MSEAKKQAVYVDVDDDITTIVGNIKSSSADTIALIPPKRIGVLQSVVNLKLLSRAAKERHKNLILVTSDSALATLAAAARIPVAKNLSAEPKLADAPKFESKDEVIEGDVTPQIIVNNKSDSDMVQAIIDDDKIGKNTDEPELKKMKRIPDFGKFRKWIILGAVALVGIAGVLVWLLVFAPHLTIQITAKTTDEKIDQPVFISKDSETNIEEGRIKAVVPEPVKKTSEIEFVATGKRLVGGKKASGKATLTCTLGGTATCSVPSEIREYAVTEPGGIIGGNSIEVTLTALAEGAKYNTAGFTDAISAYYLTITAGEISGGEDKANETFVQQSDIDVITEKLKSDTENSSMKTDLESRFSADVRPIPDSFQISLGAINSSPAVDKATAPDGKAKVSVEVIYSMYGLKNDDVNALLMSAASKKLKGQNGQGIFDDGFNGLQVLSYQNTDNGGSARFVTTAKIGPAINDQQLKEEAKGKKQNEIKDQLKKISGIDNVEVTFFPFWLGSIDDINRITIEKSGF